MSEALPITSFPSHAARPRRIPLPAEHWRNVKTGNIYRIEALAREESTGETMVLYRADGNVFEGHEGRSSPSILWSRPIDVFLWREDGSPRFVPHEKESTCEV